MLLIKRGTTENAKYLASVLAEVQREGHPVKWVVHSQGGIIFTSAVEYFNNNRNYFGLNSLDKNSVVFHAGGNRIEDSKKKEGSRTVLSRANIKCEFPENNPFDPVPRIAGGNDRTLKAARETAPFINRIRGDDPQCSPHTLPFITITHYANLLEINGDPSGAERVRQSKYYKEQSENQDNKVC